MPASDPPRYLEQYRRVCRAQERALALARKLESVEGVDSDDATVLEYEDAVISFFQNAWHLKDWIRNDPSIADALRVSVVSRMEADVALGACADVANGTKHLKLKRSRLGAALSKPGKANPNKREPEWELYVSLPQMPGQTTGLHAAGVMNQVMMALDHALRPNGLLRGA